MASVNSKAELIEVLKANAIHILGFGVHRIGVFGSFARDTAGPDSDVDLFVEFSPGKKTLRNLVGLSRSLEKDLGRKVELVTRESLNRITGKYIVQEVEYVALAA